MTTSDRPLSSRPIGRAGVLASRAGSARPVGLAVAGTVFLLFAGVVGWYIARAPKEVAVDPVMPHMVDVPDAAELPAQPGGGQLDRLGENTGPFMQFADKKDPTRVAGEITARKAEPLESHRYRLDQPRAWNFLRDGRTLYIEADTARAYFADEGGRGRPEEATLEGRVVIKMFAKTADGARPNPATDTPLYSATMDELRFDSALGRVTIPGPAKIAGTQFTFSGADITFLFSEVAERVELLRVGRTEFLEFVPGARVADAGPAAGAPLPNSPAAAAAALALAQPGAADRSNEVEYKLDATQNVRIAQAGRTLVADVMHGWLRTVDNQIPERTRGRPGAAPAVKPAPTPAGGAPTTPATGATKIGAAEPAATAAPTAAPAALAAGTDAPVRITFEGPLEVRPLGAPSNELRHNDAFLRLTSAHAGGVVAKDDESGAQATGTLIEYGATRRDLAIGSNEKNGVTLASPKAGTLVAQRVELSLLSGRAHIDGEGRLSQNDPLLVPPDQSVRSLSWGRGADFDFAMENGEMKQRLSKALLVGDVSATDGRASFGAQQLQAEFARTGEETSRLARLFLVGKARGGDNAGASIGADSIDVKFGPGEGPTDAKPRHVTANGNFRAARAGDTISGASMSADIAQDEAGELVLTHVEGREGVVFTNADGITATSAALDADPIAKVVDLSGPDTRITRGESVITGSHIRIFADERRMDVLTPGSFTHRQEGKDGAPPMTAAVTWWRSMTFNDGLGRVECEGVAHAELKQGELSKDTLDAERVVVLLADAEPKLEHRPDADSAPDLERERTVSRVEAEGDALKNTPVKIEVRRYAAPSSLDPSPARLEQMLYLEGQRVVADLPAQTLSVPVAGKLLAVDRRAGEEEPKPGEPFGAGTRGDALFRWNGSLLMNQASGELRMLDRVRLDHRRLADGTKIELECNDLAASITQAAGGDAAPEAGQLRRAVAQGRVWMRAQGRELTAGEVAYDAPNSLVTAAGEPGQAVTLMDLKTRAPFSARWLSWNLTTDRFEALQTQPIIVPR